jgi:hypothetical protein
MLRAFCYVLSAVLLAAGSGAMAEDSAKPSREDIAKLSLIVQAPIVVDINRRYYKFYGDPNTKSGDILERSTLTGNWAGDGLRDELVDAGVYLDAAMTQFFGGNVHGGTSRRANYTGSLDLWANLDTATISTSSSNTWGWTDSFWSAGRTVAWRPTPMCAITGSARSAASK